MTKVTQFPFGNRLLCRLSPSDLELLTPQLKPVVLRLRQDLERPNEPIRDVYFPDAGIVSVVATNPDASRVETGVIGCEGVSGIAVMLGNDRSPHSTYVQGAGRGMRMSAAELRRAMKASPSLQTLLHKYVQTFIVQTAHTAIANARATLPQRLARWLLMAHDRVQIDQLLLTHEFLALMMGVRRAGVTETLHGLEHRGLVEAARGEVTIRNRRGLEKLAGGYYGVPEAEYRRLIG
jgi:CRP-like cAMP-binding protein